RVFADWVRAWKKAATPARRRWQAIRESRRSRPRQLGCQAKKLGFAEPCEHCLSQIQERYWFQGYGPTNDLGPTTNVANFAVLPGPLYEVSGQDRSGAEGYTRYFACRRCGSRWWYFDWVCTGTVDYGQESADGLYHCCGTYVDGR